MGEESYGFEKTRVRLEEIVSQVRKKDVSLEKSLDLLEEGVRLTNQCVEQIDHADWDAAAGRSTEEEVGEDGAEPEALSQATATDTVEEPLADVEEGADERSSADSD